ncbi:MAG TPA: single-stranded DNA-binding protein [Mucilaginibacter sp.]|jgi:single-strand DNA-binding protein
METLTGRLTADAKVSVVNGDKKVVNFSIAMNDSYRSNGETVKTTTYVDCAYWINAGVGEYLKKGLMVTLFGRLSSRAWNDKDGNAHSAITLNTSQIKFLGGSNSEAAENPAPKAGKKQGANAGCGEDDDLPF